MLIQAQQKLIKIKHSNVRLIDLQNTPRARKSSPILVEIISMHMLFIGPRRIPAEPIIRL